jgi:AsmA protein
MQRVLTVLLWVVAVAVAVLVAVVVGISLFFDPNDYKARIVRLVHERTGRDLQMAGDLRLTFFPWFGVEAREVALGDAPGFGPEPFAKVARLQVRVKLLSLLRKPVEMDTVVVHGLMLHLIKDAHGRGNWQDLAGSTGAPPAKEGTQVETGGPPPAAALALGGLDVRDAQLAWEDRGAGSRYAVTGLDLHTGALLLDGPVAVTLAGDVESTAPAITGHVDLAGAVAADLAGQRATVSGAHVVAQLRGPGVPGGEVAADVTAVLHVDLAKPSLQVSELRAAAELPAAGLPVGGKVVITGAADADLSARRLSLDARHIAAEIVGAALPGGSAKIEAHTAVAVDLGARRLTMTDVRGTATTAPGAQPVTGTVTVRGSVDYDLAHSRLRTERLELTADLHGAALPRGALAVALSGGVAADLAAETAVIDDLRLRALDLDVHGRMRLAQWRTAPALAGEVDLAPFTPRELLARLGTSPPACADPKVLGRASLTAKVAGTETSLRLSDLRVVLDDSQLTGTVAVNGFERPALRGDVTLDAIDVDRYLPPPATGEAPSPPPAAPGIAAAGTELPSEMLRTLDLDATVRIGRLKAANVRLTDVVLTATAQQGQLRLHPATAHLYDGDYRGDVRIDVRGAEPVVRLDETLAGVNAGPLLRDTVGEERVTGKATLHAQLTARGSGAPDCRRGGTRRQYRPAAA